MFGMFRKKAEPAAVPPIFPSTTIPLPPVLPREHHRFFTHDVIPGAFITDDERSATLAKLFSKNGTLFARQAWEIAGARCGASPIPGDALEVTFFRNEPFVCAHWEFPAARCPGESILGLLILGPMTNEGRPDWSKIPCRYFVMDCEPDNLTVVKEWSPKGFIAIGPGAQSGDSVTLFADKVFDHVMGKKRPTAEQVAKRLIILKSVATYSQAVPFGQQLHALPDLKLEAKNDLHSIFGGMFGDTLRKENLWEDVSPTEKQFFDSPVANQTQQQIINASWRLEAVQVLMWSLGLLRDLPGYDVRATPNVFKQSPTMPVPEFIASAKLRDETEIDRARDLAESWHWRSRTRELQEAGQPCPANEAMKKAGLTSFDAIVRMSAKLAVERGDLPNSIGEDYPAKGKAYRDLTADEWSEVRSITVERHFALNWLCGYAPGNEWDNTPTET